MTAQQLVVPARELLAGDVFVGPAPSVVTEVVVEGPTTWIFTKGTQFNSRSSILYTVTREA
jgi:hypothetical protein